MVGFAGALREIGLPEGEIPLALFSFNLGVEIGQLLFITPVLLIGATLRSLSASGTTRGDTDEGHRLRDRKHRSVLDDERIAAF